MCVVCASTVRSVTKRRAAIAWFDMPSAMSPSTSRSLAVKSASGSSRPPAADESRDDRGVDDRLALRQTPQSVDEDGNVEDALLEQVADAFREFLDQPHRIACLDVLGEDENGCLWLLGPDCLGRDEALVGVGGRHPDVDDRDVGVLAADRPEQAVGIVLLGHNLDARVG